MSKTELKAALESLQVSKPLRLSAKAPSFRAPPVQSEPRVETIPGSDSSPGSFATQGLKAPEGVNPTRVTPDSTAQEFEMRDETENGNPEVTLSLGTNRTQGVNATQGLNPTQDIDQRGAGIYPGIPNQPEGQMARRSQPRRATHQDEAVLAAKSAESGLARGYTRIPNSLLMRLVSGDCSKHETQVLLLVARMTISFRRDKAPLSKSVIERFTGIRGSSALQALASLENAALIQRIPGDERRPSQIGLKLDPGWDWLANDAVTERPIGNPGVKSTQGSVSSRDVFAPGDRIEPASPGGIHPTRNNRVQNDKEILLSLPEKLRKYFDELRPQRKRESELQAYQELKADYSDDDIADCLEHVVTRGIGAGEERVSCHSPLAYLAKAIHEVLAGVESERAMAQKRVDWEQREVHEAREKVQADERERREWETKERAFMRIFPSEERQQEALSKLVRDTPFRAKGVVARIFAVNRWWDLLSQDEREEATR